MHSVLGIMENPDCVLLSMKLVWLKENIGTKGGGMGMRRWKLSPAKNGLVLVISHSGTQNISLS